uniref:Uncharacterized protein n=1 Tax=Sphaerodactylus townsendi TaxID=933632 RepID=A0ACB8FUN3_9SAUR
MEIVLFTRYKNWPKLAGALTLESVKGIVTGHYTYSGILKERGFHSHADIVIASLASEILKKTEHTKPRSTDATEQL